MRFFAERRVVNPAGADESKLPVILVCQMSNRDSFGAVYGSIDAQDGEVLAQHFSSSDSFGWRDNGGTPSCDWKHEFYRAKYPNGFVLAWAELGSPEFLAALALNKKRFPEEETSEKAVES